MKKIITMLGISCLTLLSGQETSNHWLTFRGNFQRTGYADVKLKFPLHRQIPKTLVAEPISNEPVGGDTTTAINSQNGQRNYLWSHQKKKVIYLKGGLYPPHIEKNNSYLSYSSSWSGVTYFRLPSALEAIDKDGNIIWSHDFQEITGDSCGAPVIMQDFLYVCAGKELLQLNLQTGQKINHFTFEGMLANSMAVVPAGKGRSEKLLLSLIKPEENASKIEIWQLDPLQKNRKLITAMVNQKKSELVFLVSSKDEKFLIHHDNKIIAYDGNSLTEVWRLETSLFFATPAIDDQYLYTVELASSELQAYHLSSGKIIWKKYIANLTTPLLAPVVNPEYLIWGKGEQIWFFNKQDGNKKHTLQLEGMLLGNFSLTALGLQVFSEDRTALPYLYVYKSSP